MLANLEQNLEKQQEQINVTVNGVRQSVRGGQSVLDLLRNLEISSDRVAVELDKNIVRKRDWERTVVADGAQVEVVEFVGGG